MENPGVLTPSFGDVDIQRCKKCNRFWLHYFLEEEWHSKSGRWFRGEISEKEAEIITPETALAYLEKQSFILYGGSYFDTSGKIGNGSIVTEHFMRYKKFMLPSSSI